MNDAKEKSWDEESLNVMYSDMSIVMLEALKQQFYRGFDVGVKLGREQFRDEVLELLHKK